MLPQVLSGLAMAAFEVALLACAVAAMAAFVIWLTRLQVRTYRISLARYFRPLRRTQYHDRGLRLRTRLLNELVNFDAVELLSNGTATSRSELPRWTLDLSKRIEASFRNPEVHTDTTGVDRDKLQADLLRLVPGIEWRYEVIRALLCCTFGVVLCVLVDYSFVPTLSSGELTLFGGGGILAAHGSPVTVALSGIICGACSHRSALHLVPSRASVATRHRRLLHSRPRVRPVSKASRSVSQAKRCAPSTSPRAPSTP